MGLQEKSLLEIARIVSDNDKNVMDEVLECVSDIESYFSKHYEDFDDRFIEDFEDEDEEMLIWLGIVDILYKNSYVCERDWKDEKEDFIYFLEELKGMKKNSLKIDENSLDEDDGIVQWCSILDKEWQEKGFCVSAFDIESDSYVLFPCKLSDLEKLQELAEQVEQRIDFAKNM